MTPATEKTVRTRDAAPEADGPVRALAQAARVGAQVAVLERVVEPVVTTMGYELVCLEWADTARPKVLRLFVDHPGGITLDDCARLSPIVSTSLDAAEHEADADELREVLSGAYVLELSSPGLDRPLVKRRHYAAAIGARAQVRTWVPVVEGSTQKAFHGRIVAIAAEREQPDDERLGVLELSDLDAPEHHHHIPLALIRRANLVYEGEI